MSRLVLLVPAVLVLACTGDAPPLEPDLARTTSASVESSFSIDLAITGDLTESQIQLVHNAAKRWERVLAPSDPYPVEVFRPYCWSDWGVDPIYINDVIDDLLIQVRTDSIDGFNREGSTLAVAGACMIREERITWYLGPDVVSFQPVYGAVTLDSADVDHLEEAGLLEDVLVHEIGHTLGLGGGWNYMGFTPTFETEDRRYRVPSLILAGRPRRAYAEPQYRILGGYADDGFGIPVDSLSGHWREAVFGDELMTTTIRGQGNPLSRITVGALADLGFDVDMNAADVYRVRNPIVSTQDRGYGVSVGHDLRAGPVVVVNRHGKRVGMLSVR
ncbi:MAG: hypothetical protein OXH46_09855 [Gemmatimonadetes bacterium]|nr:hypothetical protein [Gemmatimonadota bacterium]